MAKFLKVIGTPFIKLWTWIKETAWVQPLLIVGVIFAIIFSIPSITSWVQSWDFGSDAYTFLQNRQLSLEGMSDNPSGQAYDFFVKFNDAETAWSDGDKEEARNILKPYVGDSNKMLLYFVTEGDDGENINEASSYLVNEAWYKVTNIDENAPAFQYEVIFTDQTIDVDEDDHTYDDHTPFDYLWISEPYQAYIATASNVGTTSNYYSYLVSEAMTSEITTLQDNVENLTDASSYTEAIPYFAIIDLTDFNTTSHIISNVFFSLDGDDKYSRSDFLAHAWTNTEEFAPASSATAE